MERSIAFAPAVREDARVIVLGSLPGQASLTARQYYANPQNQFWRLIGGVVGLDLVALPYPDRLAALAAARIGLWDVMASAVRPGSSDAAIRDAVHADLPGLVERLPDLRAIGFNGSKPAQIGRPQLSTYRAMLTLVDLPSSSSASTHLPFTAKLARWAELGR